LSTEAPKVVSMMAKKLEVQGPSKPAVSIKV
jgi:hypothetical protein